MRQTTTAEVRLDAGKAEDFSASARSRGSLDALPPTRCAIYCCPRGPWGPSCPHNHPESGECRLMLSTKEGVSWGREADACRNADQRRAHHRQYDGAHRGQGGRTGGRAGRGSGPGPSSGHGRSTLLRIAAGLVQPDAGDRFAQPRPTTVSPIKHVIGAGRKGVTPDLPGIHIGLRRHDIVERRQAEP
jgi:hypothetical protein